MKLHHFPCISVSYLSFYPVVSPNSQLNVYIPSQTLFGFVKTPLTCVNMVDRPIRLRIMWFGFPRNCHIFPLTSMSLRERPFLYIMDGSLKIRFSNGCCIRYHLLVKVSLRFGTAAWYCVMKGKIRFFVSFCWKGLVSLVQTSSGSALLMKFCGQPLSIRCFLNFVMFSLKSLF